MQVTKSLGMAVAATILASQLAACVPLVAAGAGGAVLVGADRRSSGVYVDDQTTEVKLAQQVSSGYPAAHVNVTSYNRAVLLTGEVPDEATRAGVELLARGMPNVRDVYNKTVVAGASSLGDRLNDGTLTSKVKARMVQANLFSPNHVKVVSERGPGVPARTGDAG
ncbi:Probable hemolysin [Laribacter hongkongensis HLHK9]|uniref:Probable hemolysin n=1 Tax=Laribacter hongkongensis (strain HLHK9) TaxID=557598 RepID=C1D5I2_LARHH|nr:BON domain-containing protein [Laribacter hongkongensis]ACO75999.1 Probable hemolysin [Laribacter hongkongensis HLHK9]